MPLTSPTFSPAPASVNNALRNGTTPPRVGEDEQEAGHAEDGQQESDVETSGAVW